MRDGTFLYHFALDAWVFVDAPLRRQSAAAVYFCIERNLPCHDGEPFGWVTCPWCGLDLPTPSIDVTWRLLTSDSPDDPDDEC
jgi:hypothetical protein